jgi:hypothetical protein
MNLKNLVKSVSQLHVHCNKICNNRFVSVINKHEGQ